MGNAPSKQWLFENVLFLDPNAPPFVSREEYERRLRAIEGPQDGESFSHVSEKRTVKRAVPPQNHLRTRTFHVRIDVEGRSAEFNLQCINDPLAFVLKDRHGRELRHIPVESVHEIIRNRQTVKCLFKNINQRRPNDQEDRISMDLQFSDMKETQAFVDTVKLMYGIFVAEYGITKPSEHDRPVEPTRQKLRGGCPVHGDVPCHCARTGGATQKVPTYSEKSEHSTDFPITIRGKVETGAILSWAEAGPLGRQYPAKVVEWRVSLIPGKEPEFAREDAESPGDLILDDQLVLSDHMVGKLVQVKVIRRIKGPETKNPVVYSLAMKGPITVNDAEAKRILQIITTPSFTSAVQITLDEAIHLFPKSTVELEKLAAHAPYINASLIVMREGLRVDLTDVPSANPFVLTWPMFYVTRLTAEQIHHIDDVAPSCVFRAEQANETLIRFATSSHFDRNSTLWRQRDHALQHFDRWSRDLEAGNFAVFKERYAKLWAVTSFYEDIVDGLEAIPSELDTYEQQPNAMRQDSYPAEYESD